ncbi:hypothetical protein CR203_15435 [Salipaludibacillus neizhouensis]|uniref:Gas vesicle protein GvpP n=1 Tax=Salipaludibacillus neizhouensis TaxID=885475 RepID=A0A3A9KNH5_9BACI|nr:hypothetical protein [Salipaludibacillus neizhouensis]RKL66286.1 hypothetical protein CR203_15435 [Salipaludibacillus neizhouensis]
MSKTDDKQSEETQNKSLNYVLVGTAVGASAGLLSSSDKGRKVLMTMASSPAMKSVGQEFRNSIQDMITEQALSSVKSSLSSYLHKAEEKMPLPDKVTNKVEEKLAIDEGENSETSQTEEESSDEESSDTSESDGYEELKEENKDLNGRLDKIEEMLTKLTESK